MARIALLAAGGGAPGAEEALRAAAAALAAAGAEVLAVRGGFEGAAAGRPGPLDGTPLGSGRFPGMKVPGGAAKVAEALKALGATAVIAAGGEGTGAAVLALAKAGLPGIHVPAAPENDVQGTEVALGVDSVLNGILRAVEAEAGPAILDVPGGLTGYCALMGAAGSAAAGALLVERPFPWARLPARLAAGARPVLLRSEGAAADAAAKFGEALGGAAPRVASLSAALRAVPPSMFDRVAARRTGESAALAILAGESPRMIAWRLGAALPVPLEGLAGRRRQVLPEVFEFAKAAGVLAE
jgi:6-phosphofructokinase 1